MKLKDFFDSCSAEEMALVLGDLDEELPEDIDGGHIEQMVMEQMGQAAPRPIRKLFARKWWKVAAAAAACLCLAVGTGAVVAEAQEYHEAVEFFRENELSTEGLTRAEIKEVYRDIISETFTYAKAAEVIHNGVSTEVKGLQIEQELSEPKAPTGAYWWEINDSCYSIIYDDKTGAERGSYFEKADKGTLIWRVPFEKITLEGWTGTSDGVLVWGRTKTNPLTEPITACLACIQDDGTLLWKKQLSHGYDSETILKVLDNGDGTYAVFSDELFLNDGNSWNVMMYQYSGGGEELAAIKILDTIQEKKWFANAMRLGDDYLVQLCDLENNEPCLVRLDRDGNFSEGFVYEAKDCDYYITDMALFSERLCLSAYAVPKIAEEHRALGGRADVAAVLDYLAAKDWWGGDFSRMPANAKGEYEGEDLLEKLRENFTAVLLICDPEKGVPENFISVQGCMGGRLNVQEELQWEVESFSSAVFSPAMNSWGSILADCRVFRYTFDASGELTGQEKTKKTTMFLR